MLKTTVINLSKKSKRVILLLSDIAVIILSYYLVMLFQYASHTEIIETFIKLPLVVFIYVVSLIIFKMYSCIWLNAGVFEFKQTVICNNNFMYYTNSGYDDYSKWNISFN